VHLKINGILTAPPPTYTRPNNTIYADHSLFISLVHYIDVYCCVWLYIVVYYCNNYIIVTAHFVSNILLV